MSDTKLMSKNIEQEILRLEFERDRLAKLINNMQLKRQKIIDELTYYQRQINTWEQTELTPFMEGGENMNVHTSNGSS